MPKVRTPHDAEGRLEGSPEGPRRRDIVLVTVLGAATLIETFLRPDLNWPAATVIVTITALCVLPWRRTHPLFVVAATTILTGGYDVFRALSGVAADGLVTMFALLTVPYALMRWGSIRARLVGGAILAVGLVCSITVDALTMRGESLFSPENIAGAVAGVAFVGGAGLIGALRRERMASRAREATAIRSLEREALARDLHDTVAHHVSAIIIRAQVASVAPSDMQRVTESLEIIEHEASAVLDDMRALVGALRGPAEYAPSPGLVELAGLATDGPPLVTVRIDLPASVPDIVATTLFRIAQEAITNARVHALDATAINVAVVMASGSVQLTVIDDGEPTTASDGSGYGLRGMTERAAVLGGSVDAGRGADGG